MLSLYLKLNEPKINDTNSENFLSENAKKKHIIQTVKQALRVLYKEEENFDFPSDYKPYSKS